MKKQTNKPSVIKALKIGGTALVGAVLVGATIVSSVNYHKASVNSVQLSDELAKLNAEYGALSLSFNSQIASNKDLSLELNKLGLELNELDNESLAKDAVLKDYLDVIDELKINNSDLSDELSLAIIDDFSGFETEEVSLSYSGTMVIDNHDYEKLAKDSLEFDGDTIRFEESLILNGSLVSNDNDFNGVTRYLLDNGELSFVKDFNVNMSALDYSEDSVKTSFLGKEYNIVNWTSDSIELKNDNKFIMNEGDVKENVTLMRIGEDSILVSFDGDIVSMEKDDVKDFGDVSVKVVDIFYDINSPIAYLQIGEELSTIIEDGDEYSEDSIYDWSITENSLGVVLNDDFVDDNNAIKAGESFALPNDYLKVSFDINDVDYSKLSFENKNSGVVIKGSFEDAVGKVTFDGTKFVDSDGENFTTLDIKDSDYTLKVVGSNFIVGDVNLSTGVDSVKVNGINQSSNKEDLLSTKGFKVVSPKDNLEDEEFEMFVPVEQVKAFFKVE